MKGGICCSWEQRFIAGITSVQPSCFYYEAVFHPPWRSFVFPQTAILAQPNKFHHLSWPNNHRGHVGSHQLPGHHQTQELHFTPSFLPMNIQHHHDYGSLASLAQGNFLHQPGGAALPGWAVLAVWPQISLLGPFLVLSIKSYADEKTGREYRQPFITSATRTW